LKKKSIKEDFDSAFGDQEDPPEFFDAKAIFDEALKEGSERLKDLVGDNCGEDEENGTKPEINLEQDRYMRAMAEFDNYRKRTAKELAIRYDDGVRAVCGKLLPIIDNFERALGAADNCDDKFFQGIELIARQFNDLLRELGVEEIPAERGMPFDPNFHNAVAHVEDETLKNGVIADVLQKGYKFQEKIIRHVLVRAAN
jgi:molecular chaperone GrpE